MKTEKMTVVRKELDDDRVLLFGDDPKYYLIAEPADQVNVGDVVEYEPEGVNFGWFRKVIATAKVGQPAATEKKPKSLDEEAAELFQKQDDKAVEELYEASTIDATVKLMAGYIKSGFLKEDEPLIEALKKLEKKKFELIEMDPEDAEDDEE